MFSTNTIMLKFNFLRLIYCIHDLGDFLFLRGRHILQLPREKGLNLQIWKILEYQGFEKNVLKGQVVSVSERALDDSNLEDSF